MTRFLQYFVNTWYNHYIYWRIRSWIQIECQKNSQWLIAVLKGKSASEWSSSSKYRMTSNNRLISKVHARAHNSLFAVFFQIHPDYSTSNVNEAVLGNMGIQITSICMKNYITTTKPSKTKSSVCFRGYVVSSYCILEELCFDDLNGVALNDAPCPSNKHRS